MLDLIQSNILSTFFVSYVIIICSFDLWSVDLLTFSHASCHHLHLGDTINGSFQEPRIPTSFLCKLMKIDDDILLNATERELRTCFNRGLSVISPQPQIPSVVSHPVSSIQCVCFLLGKFLQFNLQSPDEEMSCFDTNPLIGKILVHLLFQRFAPCYLS